MNQSMNTQRITISIPDYIYKQLTSLANPRGVSRFVADALEEKIIKTRKNTNAVEDFLALRKILPKRSIKQIIAAIHKGRT